MKSLNHVFDMTFEEWCDLWDLSGKYHLRGNYPGSYTMSIIDVSLPITLDNVEIISYEDKILKQCKRKGRPVKIDGKEYFSISSAAKNLGISVYCVTRRVKSKRFPNYTWA